MGAKSASNNRHKGEFEFHEAQGIALQRDNSQQLKMATGFAMIIAALAIGCLVFIYLLYRDEVNARLAAEAKVAEYDKIIGYDNLKLMQNKIESSGEKGEQNIAFITRVYDYPNSDYPESISQDKLGLKFNQLSAMIEQDNTIRYHIDTIDHGANGGYVAKVTFEDYKHYVVSYAESGDFVMDLYGSKNEQRTRYYYRVNASDQWHRSSFEGTTKACEDYEAGERASLKNFKLQCKNAEGKIENF